MRTPTRKGRFGEYGGRWVPESLVPACLEVADAFEKAWADPGFRDQLQTMLARHVGRPTPVTPAERLSAELGVTVALKREDLTHTGSHKINNAVGQALLAKRMGKRRLIAETGAGMHGVATATAGALLDLPVTVFMGEQDVERQSHNVFRMRYLGAEVVPVRTGSRTLKDATSEAMRHWVSSTEEAHYCLGSVVGPHPYPWMVREFQRVIGDEAREQHMTVPDYVVACVGGGSNAAGTFAGFARHQRAAGRRGSDRRIGRDVRPGRGAARFAVAVPPGRARADPRSPFDRRRTGLPRRRAGTRAPARPRAGSICRGRRRSSGRRGRAIGSYRGDHPGARIRARARLGGRSRRSTPDLPAGSTVLLTLSGRGDKDITTLIARSEESRA